MKTTIRASLALAMAAALAVGTASAQAPAPSAPKTATPPAAAAPAVPKSADDILETASKAGNFKIFARALEAADLTKVLKGKGPFTVFAPTDEAFGKLSKEQLDALLEPKNKRWLVSTMGSHVLAAKVLKSDRMTKAINFHAKMHNGSLVAISAKDPAAGLTFGGAKVVKADIEASNGVVHAIDAVYLPKRVRAALYAIDKTAKAKAAAGPALEKAKQVGGKALEATKDAAGKAVEATKDAAGKAVDKAKELTAPKTTVPAPK